MQTRNVKLIASGSHCEMMNDSTLSAFIAVLARAFRHAERARLIDRTPFIGLRRPPIASRAADAMITRTDHVRLHEVSTVAFSPVPGISLSDRLPASTIDAM
jgi:hypothetical protein